MEVTFLGTATSQGVPVIACDCEVCRSADFRDKRLRTSILIRSNQKNFIIDSGPDFRQQVLRERISDLAALIMTHEHKDHIAGMDDIRAFNYKEGGKDFRVFAHPRVQAALKREFSYAFADERYPGVPLIELISIDNIPFEIDGVRFTPIEVMHYKLPVFGFRVEDFTYITDANFISEVEMNKIRGSKVLVLNALRKEDHISHYSLRQALEVIEELKPERAYLTHLSHQMGLHKEVEKQLPPGVKLAYDGLKINIS
ncbi:MAG: MBL fold metallo-hydrolase [Cytophagaceae bacterium]|nr:MBL fold metallo-hydrolase [Cytophagaceae bacterium]